MANSTLSIRNKLFEYIRVADNKKLNAIYNLLESEIEQTSEWWKDKSLLKELDNRHNALDTGTDTGFTTPQLVQSINKLRQKKYGS